MRHTGRPAWHASSSACCGVQPGDTIAAVPPAADLDAAAAMLLEGAQGCGTARNASPSRQALPEMRIPAQLTSGLACRQDAVVLYLLSCLHTDASSRPSIMYLIMAGAG